MFVSHDDHILLVTVEPIVELSVVVVELDKGVDDKPVCVELGGTFVPVLEAALVRPGVLGEVPVDVLLEILVVDVDAGCEPDVKPVEGVDFPLIDVDEASTVEVEPEFNEKVFVPLVGVDEAFRVEEEGPELHETVFVPLTDEPLVVDNGVADPDPELVLDTPLDELPVIGHPTLVIVMFPGVPDAQLEAIVVVFELENVTEVHVSRLVDDVSPLPLIELELRFMDIVVTMGDPLASVFVTVVRLTGTEGMPLPLPLPVADADAEFVVVFSPGPRLPVVVEDTAVVPELALPVELVAVDALIPPEVIDRVSLLVGIVAVELDELPPALLEAIVKVDSVEPVALPAGPVAVEALTLPRVVDKVPVLVGIDIVELGGLPLALLEIPAELDDADTVELPAGLLLVEALAPPDVVMLLVGMDTVGLDELPPELFEVPAELAVVEVLAPPEVTGKLPLLVGIVAVGLSELPPELLEAVVDAVALPEEIVNVSEMINVVVLEVSQLEVSESVFILDEPAEEETVDPPEVHVLDPDEPDELVAVAFPLVAEEEIETVGSVVADSVHEGITDELEAFLETVADVVKETVEVVCQTGTVVLPETVVTRVESLVHVLVPVQSGSGATVDDGQSTGHRQASM
ncbi:hypothetical protein EKO27_g10899 [Xylaria grammica]|uniref:Uncharacterized protein n=1 Tax=Xylaria grammica TaxID=363999 RepID=A0A439CPY6_9PEZI|nr:hypothetical protein EKO27_g10899 [Xylaria grammica]